MKVFIIHSIALTEEAVKYAKRWEEEGHETYVPGRDTPQNESRVKIIQRNREGLEWCDEVRMIWNGTSQGSLFDLGTAYALRKPTKIVKITNNFSRKTESWKKGSLPWTGFCRKHVGKYIW